MKIKKIFAIALVCFFAMYSVSFAAIGGGKAKFSAPRPSTSQSAPKAADTAKNGYKSSAPAKNYSDKAPEANSKANVQQQAGAKAQSGSFMGSAMRNIGLLAGGMMLGSLLGSMFGMGTGLFADILGLVANIFIFGAIFMLGSILWSKYKNRNNDRDRYERNNRN